jgi:hypothetical protein
VTREMFTVRDDATSDEFQAILTDNHVQLRIAEPWSGDTESGSGDESSFTLPKEDAIDFALNVLAFYNAQ